MELNCERAMGIIIPAVRISVSKRLKREGMTQGQISKALGIRQATVSKYISGKYSSKMRLAVRLVDSKGVSEKFARMAHSGKAAKEINAALDSLAFRKELIKAASTLN